MMKRNPVDNGMLLEIGYQTYEVRFVDIIPGTGTQLGTCSRGVGNIFILDNSNLPDEEVVNTLIHEVLHALYWSRGIEEGDSEERLVGSMADGLTEVIVRNPHLLDWIYDRLNRGSDKAEDAE